jgi:putative transposase
VNKSSTNKYYVSVLVEFEKEINTHKEKQNEKIIGLDMSMDKFFVATSNSENQTITPGYIRFYRKAEKKLKKAQRKFSKCKTGSKRRQKKKLKVSVIHEIIANQRRDFINKLSTKLVREYDTIVVETLSLSGMKQALSLGKSISDLGYSKFINQLQYKSLWYDKNLVMADKWFASSKLCNVCGYKNKELKLNQREWTCPNCGTWHDRDINASQNLLNLYTVGTTEINARGEIVKPNQHISGNLIKSRS